MTFSFFELLTEYRRRYPDESRLIDRFFQLRRLENPFNRNCRPGHFTASALIVDKLKKQTLLVEHRKLGIWVQPGGHADDDENLVAVARREIEEETGLAECFCDGLILDLDIHTIPSRKTESEHDHYDVRFLFTVNRHDPIRMSDESTDLRWIPIEKIRGFTRENSILRMLRKAGVFG